MMGAALAKKLLGAALERMFGAALDNKLYLELR